MSERSIVSETGKLNWHLHVDFLLKVCGCISHVGLKRENA